MKYSVFIASSLDNYIAREDNSLSWLESNNQTPVDMGFNNFLSNVDCIVMGKNTMKIINEMDLSSDQWPYDDLPIIVLSKKLKDLPGIFKEKGEIYSGDLNTLTNLLEDRGYKNIYIDGGATIRSFLNLGLITDLTLSIAPVILGRGIPLFSGVEKEIKLSKVKSRTFSNDFIQVDYKIQ